MPANVTCSEAFFDNKPVSVHFSSAWDRRMGAQVAIKKLHRPFQSKLFAKRAFRELRLLKHMKHENVRMCLRLADKEDL